VNNLANAGIDRNVFLVGDTVIDLISENADRIEQATEDIIAKLGLTRGHYIFMTCHRAANTELRENLKEILSAIITQDMPVVFPAHPRTVEAMRNFEFMEMLEGSVVHLVDPIGFWQSQALIRHARHVVTDSGGIIKEAYFHRTHCVVVDRQTEWVEVVDEGWVDIAGPDASAILHALNVWTTPLVHRQTFGDGNASGTILEHTRAYLDRENIPKTQR
jgi:UDP-N-acetylglucosamine 2-epimerase (non-hydrolysing)